MTNRFINSLVGDGKSRGSRVIPTLAGLVLAGCFLTGCSKSQPPNVETPPPATESNPAPAVATPAPPNNPAPVVVAAKPEGGADLKQLNQAYIGWIVSNKRRPKSFEEFVTLSGIKVPPPPAGKKYVIDQHGYINFADQ